VAGLRPDLGLDDSNALQADLLQRLFYFVELEGLDDGFDLLHARLRLPTSIKRRCCADARN
jgi:hypothetical protein